MYVFRQLSDYIVLISSFEVCKKSKILRAGVLRSTLMTARALISCVRALCRCSCSISDVEIAARCVSEEFHSESISAAVAPHGI